MYSSPFWSVSAASFSLLSPPMSHRTSPCHPFTFLSILSCSGEWGNARQSYSSISAQENLFPPQINSIHTERQTEPLSACTALPSRLGSCQHLSWCQKVWVLRHKNNVGSDSAEAKYKKREWFWNSCSLSISLAQRTARNDQTLHHPEKWLQMKEKSAL